MKTEYRGTKLYYEETGEGRPIILLHGFLENSSMWDYIPQSVFSTNRIIKIDLLGHGQSGCIGYVHSMEDMAMAVLFIAEELNLDKFKIIGHSMGGYVALAIARIKPKSVVGICLLNSTFLNDDKQRKQVRKRAIEMAKSNYEALVRMSFVNLFAENSRKQFSTEISCALKEALKTPVQGYIGAQEGMLIRKAGLDVIENKTIDVQVILGLEDTIVDIDELKASCASENVKIHLISSGHMSHIENNTELTYIIKQFNEK